MDVYFLKRLLRLKHDTNYETFLGTFAVRIFNIFTLVNDQTMHTLEMLFFRKGKKKMLVLELYLVRSVLLHRLTADG